MTSENVTKEELSNLLVEKHKNFIKEYRKEYDALERIAILKEKHEQLDYWVKDSKDNPTLHEKYLQLEKASDKELASLQQELKSVYESSTRNYGPSENDPKARYAWLKTQIKLHEEGQTYWTGKSKEFLDAQNVKKDEKDTSAEALKKVKKIRKTKKNSKGGKTMKKREEEPLKEEETH